MAEKIEENLRTLQQELQNLLKSHTGLKKENLRLRQQLEIAESQSNQLQENTRLLQQKVHILQASATNMTGEEKKEFEKTINRYVKAIDQCLNVLNQ